MDVDEDVVVQKKTKKDQANFVDIDEGAMFDPRMKLFEAGATDEELERIKHIRAELDDVLKMQKVVERHHVELIAEQILQKKSLRSFEHGRNWNSRGSRR